MAAGEMLVLGRDDLGSLELTWSQIVDVLEDAFRQKAAGLVQNPPKPAVRPREDAFIKEQRTIANGRASADRASLPAQTGLGDRGPSPGRPSSGAIQAGAARPA